MTSDLLATPSPKASPEGDINDKGGNKNLHNQLQDTNKTVELQGNAIASIHAKVSSISNSLQQDTLNKVISEVRHQENKPDNIFEFGSMKKPPKQIDIVRQRLLQR